MTGVELFFISKAILGIVSLGLLIFYMGYVWQDVRFPGRKLRYVVLLWFTLTTVSASARQVVIGSDSVYLESWLVMVGLVFLFGTMIFSIKEVKKIPKHKE